MVYDVLNVYLTYFQTLSNNVFGCVTKSNDKMERAGAIVNESRYENSQKVLGDIQTVLERHPDWIVSESVDDYKKVAIFGSICSTVKSIQYNTHVRFWFPYNYPESPPIAVIDFEGFDLCPRDYINYEGRIRHDYLTNWNQNSSFETFFQILAELFSQKPPLVQKRQIQPSAPQLRSNDQDQSKDLQKHNQQEVVDQNRPQSYECLICTDASRDVTYNPCGHGSCSKCAVNLKTCHTCRQPIESKIKMYF